MYSEYCDLLIGSASTAAYLSSTASQFNWHGVIWDSSVDPAFAVFDNAGALKLRYHASTANCSGSIMFPNPILLHGLYSSTNATTTCYYLVSDIVKIGG